MEGLITVGACYGYEGRGELEKGTALSDGRKVYFDYLIDSPNALVSIIRKYMGK